MKRTRASRTDSLIATTGGEQGFWPSYADMMSAIALILFFLMLLAYIQNLITGNSLQETQDELASTQNELVDTRSELDETSNRLALTLTQVQDAEAELKEISIDLDAAKVTLTNQQNEIAAQDAALADQEALIAEQAEYMKAANKELLEMRSQMQTISVLRLSIVNQIRESLIKSMGSADSVSISDSGNIVLSESILFDVGSSDIKAEAKPALNQLCKVFAEFLSESDNARYVDSIVISGHTDSTGSVEDNRILSTDRANSVLAYLMDSNYGILEDYAEYFCAAGYGASRPVQDNGTAEGRSANRRIEISITLKDDTVMDILETYLDIEVPESVLESETEDQAAEVTVGTPG